MGKRQIVCILLSLISFLFMASPVLANDQFHTQITVFYEFDEDGTSQVTQSYALTNLTSQTGAAAYEFDLLASSPDALQAFDSHGAIDLKTVTHQSGLTRVIIPFNQLNAGKGRTYKFYLTYTGPKVSKVDRLWKITLPNTSSSSPNQDTLVQLSVPENFGHPLTLHPATSDFTRKSNRLIYTFPKGSSEVSSGIYAIFGNLNLVGFNLSYSSISKNSQLHIPKDQPGQLVFVQDIQPPPDNVMVTADGNWKIQYKKIPEASAIKGYILLDASASASFPQTGKLSLSNLTSLPEAIPSLPRVYWQKPFQLNPFFAFPSNIIVENSGSQAIYHLQIFLTPRKILTNGSTDINIPIIPPFGKVIIPMKFYSPLFPDLVNYQLTIQAGTTIVTYNIETQYFIIWYVTLIILTISIILSVGYFTYHTWGLHFQKSHQ